MQYTRFLRTFVDAETLNNSSFSSPALVLDPINGMSIQATWSGTDITGNIVVQCSVDGANWCDIQGFNETINASDFKIWHFVDLYYRYLRVYVEETSGNDMLVSSIYYGKGI